MRLALQQAQTIIGNTSTNPAVGCVIVKDGCVVSAASTNINGRPHAEYKALNNILLNFSFFISSTIILLVKGKSRVVVSLNNSV